MFRNYDLRFLIPYVILMLLLSGLVIWYETAYRTEDSWPETVIAIGQGISSVVSVTFIFFATVEGVAYMVLALMRLRELKKENEEKLEEGLQKGLEQGLEQGIEQGIERGIEQGIEQGREQGIEQGREQGLEQGREEGREQGIEEGREEGIERGRLEERRRWEGWIRRGEEARAAGQPFDEPPPSSQGGSSSNHSS